ncbi:hypothetical protein PVAP13_3NG291882 [Panicum virgatum]|uniref:PB1 domain-containing protein n=1 Tax=Panicum virgatum TaxID=38727 RepID=A0A8T0UM88_PANVG|nr:hypothetical protein PVAP13_3NG291882 [Panicum virgatum]
MRNQRYSLDLPRAPSTSQHQASPSHRRPPSAARRKMACPRAMAGNDGKFLHIPVLDGDGRVAACLDVLHLTHAAISMFEGGLGTANDVANTMMQKFWNSALALEPPDDDFDSHSDLSLVTPSEAGDGTSSMYPPAVGNSFVFKLRDQNGRLHRFTCGSKSLDELISSIMQRLGIGGDKSTVQLLYEDDEGDKVLLTTDSDLAGAVLNAKSSRLKALKLHIDDSDSKNKVAAQQLSELEPSHGIQLMDVHYGLMTCPPEGRSFIKEESCCHNVEVEHQLCLSHLKTCYVVFIVVADYRSAMCCSFILNLYSCSCN